MYGFLLITHVFTRIKHDVTKITHDVTIITHDTTKITHGVAVKFSRKFEIISRRYDQKIEPGGIITRHQVEISSVKQGKTRKTE